MSFLKHFAEAQRNAFLAAGSALRLQRGEHLMRRGEPGGDIFLVRSGTLEVVDTRSTPEVILTALEAGDVVGEMAFVDDSPRSADVRAVNEAEVLRWARDDLRAMLKRQPALAAVFYETVARMASDRIRNLTTSAVAGVIARREGGATPGLTRAKEEAARIAEEAKEDLLECETRLRQDPHDKVALADTRKALDELRDRIAALFTNHPESDISGATARLLCRELHPYLVRSSLAERCIRRPQGVTGTAEILAHVLVDTAGGDGQLGEILDRWLLDLPTLGAFRAFQAPTVTLVGNALPTHRNRRLCLMNAGTGSLVAALNHVVAKEPTVVTVIDQSRDALAFLDAGITYRPRAVDLNTQQESLAQLAMGRARTALPPQDVLILPNLLEYLPDRLAISMLSVAFDMLAVDGSVVLTALEPSPDQYLLDRLLDWPTIRRSKELLRRMVRRAGFEIVAEPAIASPALLMSARRTGARARAAKKAATVKAT